MGLAGFAIGVVTGHGLMARPAAALLALLACTAAPMWWYEARRHAAAQPRPGEARHSTTSRRRWRLYGLVVAGGLWAATLNLLPLANASVTDGFWLALPPLLPLLLAGALLYVLWPEGTEVAGLERIGQWLHRRPAAQRFPWPLLRDQLVKAFFLPLMISFAYRWAGQSEPVLAQNMTAVHWYALTVALLYLVDTAFGTVGYLSTAKRLGAQIQSSNPYWLGWAAALVCYPPFFTWLQDVGFTYRDGYQWSAWLAQSPVLLHVWGTAVVLLTAIYALSTVVFGIRFSNLTHRGIITHGPYRWSKHPAYISKNLSWWLVSIPFVSNAGVATAAVHCLILLCINGIYWLRARTEERHLMHDPVYREYALWISRHGLIAKLLRRHPTT